jgi:hypothetical protein
MEGGSWRGLTDDDETFRRSVDVVRAGGGYLTDYSDMIELKM